MLFSGRDRVAGAVPPAFVRGGANVLTFGNRERGGRTTSSKPARLFDKRMSAIPFEQNKLLNLSFLPVLWHCGMCCGVSYSNH